MGTSQLLRENLLALLEALDFQTRILSMELYPHGPDHDKDRDNTKGVRMGENQHSLRPGHWRLVGLQGPGRGPGKPRSRRLRPLLPLGLSGESADLERVRKHQY